MIAGDAIDSSNLLINLIHTALRRKFGHADSGCIAVGFFRQRSHHDPSTSSKVLIGRGVINELPSNGVRIHSDAADVLAHAIHDQQIDVSKRQSGQPLISQLQQFGFSRSEFFGTNGFQQSGFVFGIFENRHPAADPTNIQHSFGD